MSREQCPERIDYCCLSDVICANNDIQPRLKLKFSFSELPEV